MEGPTTRCKFHVNSIETLEHGSVWVNLSVISPNASDGYVHSAEDHAFFSATPQGTLRMLINNPYGAELFQPGKDFYLDFSEAAKPEPAA